MGVQISTKGNFNKTENWFNRLLNRHYLNVLNKYGKMGVDALRRATPIDTGLASESWYYEVTEGTNGPTLTWGNSDIEGGLSVVILIDRGHATKSGSWVAGKHFIDPTLDPIIKRLEDEIWKEVTRV